MKIDPINQIQDLANEPLHLTHDPELDTSDISDAPQALHMDAAQAGPLILGDAPWFLRAEFGRDGADLQLTGEDGQLVVIEDYFSQANPPDLVSASGAVLNGATAMRLAGPLAPGQYAQTTAGPGANPIGRVETTTGTVQVTRADGSEVILSQGDPVFLGDVLETGSDAAVGITFADESTFSLGEDGRMTLDDMVYDPGAQTGTLQVNLLQGAFTFISGQIAKTDPNAMVITTPTSTIGIRGTAGGGSVDPSGGTTAALMPEADGFVGEMTIGNQAGFQTINQALQAVNIISINEPPSQPFIMTPQQLGQTFGGALNALPNAANAIPDTIVDGANEGRAIQQEAQQAAAEAEANQAEAEAEALAAEEQALEAVAEAEAAQEAQAQAQAEALAAEAEAANAIIAAEEAALEAASPTATPEQIAAAEEAAQQAEEAQVIAEQEAAQADVARAEAAQSQALAAEAEASLATANADLAQATANVVEAQVAVIETSSTGAVASAAVAAGIENVSGVSELNEAQQAVVEAQVQVQEAQAEAQVAEAAAEDAQALAQAVEAEVQATALAAANDANAVETNQDGTQVDDAAAQANDANAANSGQDNINTTTNNTPDDTFGGFDYTSTLDSENNGLNFDALSNPAGFDPFAGSPLNVPPPNPDTSNNEGPPPPEVNNVPDTTTNFVEVFTGTLGDDNQSGGPGNTQFTMIQGSTLSGEDTLYGNGGTDELTLESLNLFMGVYDASNSAVDPKMVYSTKLGSLKGTIQLSSIEQLYVNDSAAASSEVRLNVDSSSVGYGYIVAGGAGGDTITVADGTALSSAISGASPDSSISGYSIADSTTLGTILFGKAGADIITGSGKEDSIFGGTGDDTLTGGAGNDTINGGTGNDTIYSEGSDVVDGGDGTDTLVMSSLSDTVNASHIETITGGAGTDTIHLTDIDNTFTASAVETIIGGSGIDTITISGSTAIVISAGNGDDTITGGAGIDTLTGGEGTDILTGGTGNDIFRYTSTSESQVGTLRDVITDFSATDAIEDILLDGLLTGTFNFLGDETQTYGGSGLNSEARFNDTTKVLEIDTDGNGVTDMEIELQGVDINDLGLNDFTVI